MPPGRPPIARTKEEALTVRREQIRKNVQAFRKRKRAQMGSDGNCLVAKEEGDNFVLEELAHSGNQALSLTPSGKKTSNSVDTKQPEYHLNSSTPCPETAQKPFSKPNLPIMTTNIDDLTSLPPSVNTGPATLQQLASTVACTFSLDNAPTAAHWSQMVPFLVNRNRTLDLSIQALCLLQVNHLSRDDNTLPYSLIFYNRAVKSLQSALREADNMFKLDIFAATMTLGTYELYNGTTRHARGWMLHVEGGMAYLKMFSSMGRCALNHQMAFHFLETVCVFDALGSRKPNLFSRSKWWKDSVDRFGGSAYGPLLRMLTSLPGVLQRCDRAKCLELSTEAIIEWTRLLRLCLRLEDAFLDWFRRTLGGEELKFRYVREVPAIPGSIGADIHRLKNLDSNIAYPDFCTARLYLLYWSSIILLYDSITMILHRLNPRSSATNSLHSQITNSIDPFISSEAYKSTSNTFSSSILRSVEFCLDPKHGVVCKSLIILPLYVARNHFREYGDEEGAISCDTWLGSLGQKEMQFGLKAQMDI